MKNRRRAIKAELIRESKDNPGYFKYEITIKELDNSIKVVPTYGIDMQDAIKRIIVKENTQKLEKIYHKKIQPITIILLSIFWLFSTLISAIVRDYKFAYYGAIISFGICTILLIINFFKHSKNKY
jgi:hypothetical protein